MRRAMRQAGSADLQAYAKLLEVDAEALDDLLVQTTVGETYFFRDPRQFTIMRTRILPELQSRRPCDHKLRLWSAGCASGEEAYSLAILADRQGILDHVSILGTDISRAALERARQGCYRDWSLRGAGEQLVLPYMVSRDGTHEVCAEIQGAVRFEYLNLALDNYPSFATGTRDMDLIMCRNVLIYFDRQTIRNVVERLFRALAEGGWLILASSDPPLHTLGLFDVIATDDGLFYRKPLTNQPQGPAAGNQLPQATLPPAPVVQQTTAPQTPLPQSAVPLLHAEADGLTHAREALAAGDYEDAAQRAAQLSDMPEAAVVLVKATANQDAAAAERICDAAIRQYPLSAELHYLHGVLLMELNRHAAATDALNRVLFLDRSIALAHFSLGVALRTLGDTKGALRAFHAARDLCMATDATDRLPLGDEDRVGDLLEAVKFQLAALDAAVGGPR